MGVHVDEKVWSDCVEYQDEGGAAWTTEFVELSSIVTAVDTCVEAT